MRLRSAKIIAIAAFVALLMSMFAVSAAAMDDTFRFDELGMSIKMPKSYYVVTRDTPRDDKVISDLNLNYDDTMTAFRNANIYMWAYDPDRILQISLIVTEDANSKSINNYSDLTAAERKTISDAIAADPSVTSAVEIKHNGNIFFDSARSSSIEDKTVYINQSNTVINGMQIDLTLQKSDEEITPGEAKVLVNAANSLSFDKIKRNTGPVFDLWRLLLWVGILAALSVAVSVIHKHRSGSGKRKLEERRARKAAESDPEISEGENGQMTFEESLGYQTDDEFKSRSEADELAGSDISVRERDPSKGVAYFEDGGDGIDDGSDYFDTYFEEPTEKRGAIRRFFGTIGAYLKIALNHTEYFFRNLFRKIFRRKK